ncbi:hypothetical protein [Alteriqipengyuania lutimaris]|uniref:hypothetical protein n=1 Tax=Alteriqipengyuania lutimaris TaxID=1538146 RepID=UPI0015F1402F|nr:hypothetical protein [Alteriqipengyuania lutimaris]MBB3034474.1 hypothetical protein [Alteriqipengyuania lutimaris]
MSQRSRDESLTGERAERLAKQLRANLRRRKAGTREKGDPAPDLSKEDNAR